MSANYIKLYNVSSEPEAAFFLAEGSAYFYISNTDKYAIRGKNLLVGCTEIIMSGILGVPTQRLETALTDAQSSVKKIPLAKFQEGIKTFSFALNASLVLAKQVRLTNQIISKNIDILASDENKAREHSIEYYLIVNRLLQEFNKRKLPWLKNLVKDYENTLTFKKGEAYHKSAEPVLINTSAALSEKDVEFPRGAIICEEKTAGDDMFILKSGAVDVLISGNKVASIEEPGTVIGEMALLLGEQRSATLKAKNNVIITKIGRKDLQDPKVKESEIIQSVAYSLAKRHYYNIIKIDSVNRSIIDQSLAEEGGDKKAPQAQKINRELKNLKMKIEDGCKGKDCEFLRDLLSSF